MGGWAARQDKTAQKAMEATMRQTRISFISRSCIFDENMINAAFWLIVRHGNFQQQAKSCRSILISPVTRFNPIEEICRLRRSLTQAILTWHRRLHHVYNVLQRREKRLARYRSRSAGIGLEKLEQESTMKGNKKLIGMLNQRLSEELGAINQYMVHSEMLENWGYGRLHKIVMARAVTEMKHAEKLIGRILFLEGTPVVNDLSDIKIGADVPKQFANDLASENGAVKNYNDTIRVAVEVGDNATKEILDGILKDEDAHVDEIEEQLDQVAQMSLQVYLGHQIG
jgi:bacterioferritin